MNNIFDTLKSDMLQLIDLSGLIGKYNEMLFWCNNIHDKRNYSPDKCESIKEKLNVLHKQFDDLKQKYD